jgi:hypothetical protein
MELDNDSLICFFFFFFFFFFLGFFFLFFFFFVFYFFFFFCGFPVQFCVMLFWCKFRSCRAMEIFGESFFASV